MEGADTPSPALGKAARSSQNPMIVYLCRKEGRLAERPSSFFAPSSERRIKATITWKTPEITVAMICVIAITSSPPNLSTAILRDVHCPTARERRKLEEINSD